MRDRRCPHCSERFRLAGKPRDFLPSADDFDEMTRKERPAMTATQQRSPEAPTMLPGPVNGWTGKFKACRDCGRRNEMEVEDGLCATCYREQFGPLGLRQAETRRDTALKLTPRPATIAETPAPPAPTTATVKPWHPDYPDGCVNCGSSERSHQGRGLCSRCRPLSLKPGYTGNIGRKKVRVGGEWVWEDEAAQAETSRIAGDLARIGVPLDEGEHGRLASVCAMRGEDMDLDDTPTIPTPALLAPHPAPTPEPEPPAVPVPPVAEPLVPAVVASAVVGQVQAIMDAKPDLEDIPLADLLAEVQRRAGLLEARAVAAEGRAGQAEGDAAKFRAIRAVIG